MPKTPALRFNQRYNSKDLSCPKKQPTGLFCPSTIIALVPHRQWNNPEWNISVKKGSYENISYTMLLVEGVEEGVSLCIKHSASLKMYFVGYTWLGYLLLTLGCFCFFLLHLNNINKNRNPNIKYTEYFKNNLESWICCCLLEISITSTAVQTIRT